MMTSYTELTKQIGDQWVTALESAEGLISAYAAGAQRMPKLDEAIGQQLPKPSEIVEANFELAQRLMAAQRDLTLRLLELSANPESAEQPKASKSTAKA